MFVKKDGHWYILDVKNKRFYNFLNGWKIDICSPNDETCDVETWHELFLKTGYKPTETDYRTNDVWLDPDGNFYEGRAHSLQAEHITQYMYGLEFDDCGSETAEEYLVKKGWVKLTTSLMSEYYSLDGMYNHLTQKQQTAKHLWDKYHQR